MYWNGRYNNNIGPGVLYHELNDLALNKVRYPILFNCDNIFIEEKDFFDSYANLVLNTFHTGANFIELNNLNLMQYLYEKYPNYYFVISEHYYLTGQSYDNDLLQKECIKYFRCSLKNTELLDIIPDKNKILLSINFPCFGCDNFSQCDISMQASQYSYSELCPTKNCPSFNANRLICLSIDQMQQFAKQGVTNFLIEDNFADNNEYFSFLLNLFVKEEHHREVIKMWEGFNS